MTDFMVSSVVSTHDAAAITTRPVDLSTASTDQVARAVAGTDNTDANTSRNTRRAMRRILTGAER